MKNIVLTCMHNGLGRFLLGLPLYYLIDTTSETLCRLHVELPPITARTALSGARNQSSTVSRRVVNHGLIIALTLRLTPHCDAVTEEAQTSQLT